MRIIKSLASNDKLSTKYLSETHDRHIIETGYYNLDEHIICISTQIGCPMGCIFCASGMPLLKKRFIRNLSASEIVSQVKNVLIAIGEKNLKEKRVLFSFFGMGEPFLNYDSVVESIHVLERDCPNSRSTISTIGIKPDLMMKLAQIKFKNTLKLHLSLHASNDKLRHEILPKTGKIRPALEALYYFSSIRNVVSKTNYVLIKNLNDSNENASRLAKLIKPYQFVVKLSCLNEINNLKSAGKRRVEVFERILNNEGIKTCRFVSNGPDIKVGCGLLRKYYTTLPTETVLNYDLPTGLAR